MRRNDGWRMVRKALRAFFDSRATRRRNRVTRQTSAHRAEMIATHGLGDAAWSKFLRDASMFSAGRLHLTREEIDSKELPEQVDDEYHIVKELYLLVVRPLRKMRLLASLTLVPVWTQIAGLMWKAYYGVVLLLGDLCHLVIRSAERASSRAYRRLERKYGSISEAPIVEFDQANAKILGWTYDFWLDRAYEMFSRNFGRFHEIFCYSRLASVSTVEQCMQVRDAYEYIGRIYFVFAHKWFGHDQHEKLAEYRVRLGSDFYEYREEPLSDELLKMLEDINLSESSCEDED